MLPKRVKLQNVTPDQTEGEAVDDGAEEAMWKSL